MAETRKRTKSDSSKTESKKSSSSRGTGRKKETTEFDEYRKNKKKTDYDPEEFEAFRKSEKRREEDYQATLKKRKVRDEVYIIVAVLVAVLMILSYFNVCGVIGKIINTILFGLMGAFAYMFPFVFFAVVLFLVSEKKRNDVGKKIIFAILAMICLSSLLHIITKYDSVSLFESFSVGYKEKEGGGFIGHLLALPLCSLFGKLAAIIIEITALIICFMMLTGTALLSLIKQKSKEEYSEIKTRRKLNEENRQREEYEYNMSNLNRGGTYSGSTSSYGYSERPRVYAADDYDKHNTGTYVPKKTRESFISKLMNGSDQNNNVKDKHSHNAAEPAREVTEEAHVKKEHDLDMVEIKGSDDEVFVKQEEAVYLQEMAKKFGTATKQESLNANNSSEIYNDREDEYEPVISGVHNSGTGTKETVGNFGVNRNEGAASAGKSGHPAVFARGDYRPQGTPEVQSHSLAGKQGGSEMTVAGNGDNIKIVKKAKPNKPYVFPPLSKLAKATNNGQGMTSAKLKETAKKLQDALKSFGVNVTITNISCGPTVTRYELQPEQGVKVSKITSLADDIKLNLAARDIRIEAPIPGKAAIGIEVPNEINQTVYLSTLISSNEFTSSKSNLSFAVGKDLGGQVVITDIQKMPHLLIAGSTGSGKSVCINTLIMSLLYKASPDDVRLILIDPKMVELSVYNGIPHLLIPVVTDPKKASAALNWAVMEMTDRYKKFADMGVRDLEGYNKRIANQKEPEQSKSGEIYEKLPQIVIIVDELADLMMVAPGEVEEYICRLAQLARAAGIHLVIATQRPSVNVVTGLIKNNVPSRIAFAVTSQVDSRTIIDMGGAEKLLGKGDMLFYPTGYPKPVRIQGAFVSDAEVIEVVDFLKANNGDNYNSEVESKMSEAAAAQNNGSVSKSAQEPSSDLDEYLYLAGSFIIQKEKASIGGLQRQFKIGFNRAARIMDQLSEAGVVGPEEGTKPRQILMTLEAFEQYAVSNGLK